MWWTTLLPTARRKPVDEIAVRHVELIRLIWYRRNRGKGAAIRTAIEHARAGTSLGS